MKVEDEKDDEKKVTSFYDKFAGLSSKYPIIFTCCKLSGLPGDGTPPSVELSKLLVPLLPSGEDEISFDTSLCFISIILYIHISVKFKMFFF